MKIIYDLGAHNGQDIAYYLLKADKVVAVEANPAQCEEIRRRYPGALADGRLVIENCVLTAPGHPAEVDFYIRSVLDERSQFPRPADGERHLFERVRLPAVEVSELIDRHGGPHYIKIDLEYYDARILRALFAAGIRPAYLSAEAHQLEVFALMVSEGGYGAFKLVDGASLGQRYADRGIVDVRTGQVVRHGFTSASSGPYGEDVDGPWMSGRVFVQHLGLVGLGWKDIHATRVAGVPRGQPPSRFAHLYRALENPVLRRIQRYWRKSLRWRRVWR